MARGDGADLTVLPLSWPNAVMTPFPIPDPPSHFPGEFIAMLPFAFAKFNCTILLTIPSPLFLPMDHGTGGWRGFNSTAIAIA